MGPFYDEFNALSTDEPGRYHSWSLPWPCWLWGLRGADFGRRALLVLPSAWLLGSLFGLAAVAAREMPWSPRFWFVLLLGGLLAANAKLLRCGWEAITCPYYALLGLYHGYLNGTRNGAVRRLLVGKLFFLGLVSAIFILVALAGAFVVRLRAQWARIAVRVAGSWIAASGFLMLGWAVRTR